MKKFSKLMAILLSMGILLSITGCSNNISDKNTTDNNNVLQNETPMDSYDEYTIMEYLTNTEKPLILYKASKIAKDTEIKEIYVLNNGKCRKYKMGNDPTNLGELSEMSDEEILEMLDGIYEDRLLLAQSKWECEIDEKVFENGYAKLYDPIEYEIKADLFTDDSGNIVIGEMLFFPVAGINNNPYIICYSENGLPTPNELNCRNSSMSYEFFKYSGTKEFINEVTDVFYITNNDIVTATVYNSNYYGFNSQGSEWAEGNGILFFRDENTYVLNLTIDKLDSTNIHRIDPSENIIENVATEYYNAYYKSFKLYNE